MSPPTIPFNFHCGICCELLSDHNALFTSCGHFFCMPSPASTNNCTKLVPRGGASAGHCEQCGQLCDAVDIKEKARDHSQKVQEFLFADCISNLYNMAKINEFRLKHERILTENVATLRKRSRQLELENQNLRADREQLQEQIRENRRLEAEVRKLKKENERYSILLDQYKRNMSTHIGSELPPITESTCRYPRHKPSSPAPSTVHAAHTDDLSDRRHGRNPPPGATSTRRSKQPQLSVAMSRQRPLQASSTIHRRALVHQAFSNTVPKTRHTEQATDPRRFQSSRVNARRRDNYGFGSGAYATSVLRGTMPSDRYSNRRQTQSNTWQDRVSVLPRPSATPDLMRRLPRRDNDGGPVNPVISRLSRR